MGARDYTTKTLKILFAESGNLCAFPGCDASLVEDGSVICNIAHILPASPNGPRGGESDGQKLNDPQNLVLLCLKHHKIVDDQPTTHDATKLRGYKTAHAARVAQAKIEFRIDDEQVEAFRQQLSLQVTDSQLALLQGVINNKGDLAINISQIMGIDQRILDESLAQHAKEVKRKIDALTAKMEGLVDKQELADALKDPSANEFIRETLKTASLAEDPELYQILAKAVATRIRDERSGSARKDTAFAQVPGLISQLTTNQMKLVAVHYIATALSSKLVQNLGLVNFTFASIVKPLGNVHYHVNDVSQISGTTAATYVSIMANTAFDHVKRQYEHLFINTLPAESVENSEIDKKLKENFMHKTEAGYTLIKPLSEIETYAKEHSLIGFEAIKQLHQMHKQPDDIIKKRLESEAPYLYWAVNINDSTRLTNLELTLPGRALALAVLEGYSKTSLGNLWEPDEDQADFPMPSNPAPKHEETAPSP